MKIDITADGVKQIVINSLSIVEHATGS